MLDSCNHKTHNASKLISYFAALNLIFYSVFVAHFNLADVLRSRPIIIDLKYRKITFEINSLAKEAFTVWFLNCTPIRNF